MKRVPSEAVYFHARLNPATSEADKAALEIINDLISRNYNFKEIAVDAILRSAGVDPATLPQTGLTASALEDLLTRFGDRLINEIKAGGGYIPQTEPEPDEGNGKPSPFTRRFAQSFANRKGE